MTTVGEHIQSTDAVICQNVDSLTDQRELLSQNVLAQLRNLVEGVAVRLQLGSADADYDYPAIGLGLAFVKAWGQYRFLSRFHKLLEASASHYTLDGDASERLMLKYYEYLLRIRTVLKERCGISVLANLESFPVDLDPSLREYHEKIAARIERARSAPRPPDISAPGRCYIHKTRYFNDKSKLFLAHQPGDRQSQAQSHRPGLDLPDDQQPDPPDRTGPGVRPPGHRRVQHRKQR